MLTGLFTTIHADLMALPPVILTSLLVASAFVLFFIAVLPKEHALLKAVALAYVVLP
jgi:hypothetical protein